MFEGPFFAPLASFSAAMVRSWLHCLYSQDFFQIRDGMSSPWLRLASNMSVEGGREVAALRACSSGKVGVELSNGSLLEHEFDRVVLAVPAPVATKILDRSSVALVHSSIDTSTLEFLRGVQYVAQVRIYTARVRYHLPCGCSEDSPERRSLMGVQDDDTDANVGLHLVPPHPVVGTIEHFSGSRGAWGSCPSSMQWALVCASGTA